MGLLSFLANGDLTEPMVLEMLRAKMATELRMMMVMVMVMLRDDSSGVNRVKTKMIQTPKG